MTISEVIAFADGIEPNAYTDAQKTVWLTAGQKVGTRCGPISPPW